MRYTVLLTILFVLFAGCEKPAPKEKSPEHQACIAQVEEYAACKTGEAEQLGELAGKQIKRSIEANRRLANGSLSNCEDALSRIADDPCAP